MGNSVCFANREFDCRERRGSLRVGGGVSAPETPARHHRRRNSPARNLLESIMSKISPTDSKDSYEANLSGISMFGDGVCTSSEFHLPGGTVFSCVR